MNKLRLGLIYLQSQSELERNLIKILCAPSHEVPRRENIRVILTELREVIRGRGENEKSLAFIEKIESLKTWEEIVKTLLIAHRAINEGALTFLNQFTLHSFKNIQELPINVKDKKSYDRCTLTEHYYRYLRAYCENYFGIKDALQASRTIGKYSDTLITSKNIEGYIALKQLLFIVAKTEDRLTATIDFLDVPIVKEMGKMILKDAVQMYNALSEYVSATIPQIFEQDEETALKLDELYSDLIKLTKKIDSLYQMRGNFNDFVEIKVPKLFKLDSEFNKKEELFIYDIRKRRKLQEKKEITPSRRFSSNENESVGFFADNKLLVSKQRNSSHDSPLAKKREQNKGYASVSSLNQIDHTDELNDKAKLVSNSKNYMQLCKNTEDAIDVDELDLSLD